MTSGYEKAENAAPLHWADYFVALFILAGIISTGIFILNGLGVIEWN